MHKIDSACAGLMVLMPKNQQIFCDSICILFEIPRNFFPSKYITDPALIMLVSFLVEAKMTFFKIKKFHVHLYKMYYVLSHT